MTTFKESQVARMRELIGQHAEGGWEKTWQEKNLPWDSGAMQPPLREAVEKGQIKLPTGGRAIVPGCGHGYEAAYLASLGLNTLGLDLSTTATASAQKFHAGSESKGSLSFQEGDFFKHESADGTGYDVAYDYTFFVAMPPANRAPWGKTMTRLVKSGGQLITLVFPIDGDRKDGPPYSVTVEDYRNALGLDNWDKVLDVVSESSERSHIGRERLCVWRRK